MVNKYNMSPCHDEELDRIVKRAGLDKIELTTPPCHLVYAFNQGNTARKQTVRMCN